MLPKAGEIHKAEIDGTHFFFTAQGQHFARGHTAEGTGDRRTERLLL
jgi:hypothetical protein